MDDVKDKQAMFEFIRGLSFRLDMFVGIENRKLILAGNEKITLGTNPLNWSMWFHDVSVRMSSSIDLPTRDRIMAQLPKPSNIKFDN